MTKRIFRSILIVAFVVLLACLALILGVLYSHFNAVQQTQLKMETQLAAQGVERLGINYFEELTVNDSRITWIAADGTVLYDSQYDPKTLENHKDREEVTEALASGRGESVRYSSTLTERSLYYALRLSDGTVLRLSMLQSTALNLFLGIAQPICVVIAVALVLSMILASRLSKKIVEPLNRLNLDDPLSNEGYDELAPLLKRIDSQQRTLKKQTADLRRKQEEFLTVTKNMAEGLVLLGTGETILSINPAAARFLGTDLFCVGRDILTVNRMSQLRSVLKAAREGRHGETDLVLDGKYYRLDASAVCSEGETVGLVLLIVDVTDKEQAELLRREFTGNVSHELKTPLHAISGYAELIADGIARPEDVAGFAKNIHSEAMGMIRLIEDIMSLSRLDEGALDMTWEQTDLYALAEQTVESLQKAAGEAGVSLTLCGDPAPMEGIPQLLGAIVRNLCDNAIKYNRPDGRVEVRITVEEKENVLTVKDTGIGIPSECQERIFERFYRVDKSHSKEVGGTGLGLSIVKHAARILNARIDLQSTPGVGTTVTAYFPTTKD